MECKRCQKDLSAYYDKALEEKEYQAISVHLKMCKTCQEEYKKLKQISDILHTKQVEEMPPLLHEKAMTHIKKVSHPMVSNYMKGIGGLVAGVLIGVCCLTNGAFDKKQEISETQVAMARAISSEEVPMEKGRNLEASFYDIETHVTNEMQEWEMAITSFAEFENYLKHRHQEIVIYKEVINANTVFYELETLEDSEALLSDLKLQDFTISLDVKTKIGKKIRIQAKV